MRIELHLFLWVSALAGCFGAISYGSARTDYLAYEGELGSTGYFPHASQEPEHSSATQFQVPDLVATSLFPSAIAPVAPVVVAPPQALPGIVLKGIVDLGGAPKGILAGETGEYATVGAGEAFLDARVLSVSADSLVLSRRDGSETKLLLRGAGELP